MGSRYGDRRGHGTHLSDEPIGDRSRFPDRNCCCPAMRPSHNGTPDRSAHRGSRMGPPCPPTVRVPGRGGDAQLRSDRSDRLELAGVVLLGLKHEPHRALTQHARTPGRPSGASMADLGQHHSRAPQVESSGRPVTGRAPRTRTSPRTGRQRARSKTTAASALPSPVIRFGLQPHRGHRVRRDKAVLDAHPASVRCGSDRRLPSSGCTRRRRTSLLGSLGLGHSRCRGRSR